MVTKTARYKQTSCQARPFWEQDVGFRGLRKDYFKCHDDNRRNVNSISISATVFQLATLLSASPEVQLLACTIKHEMKTQYIAESST